MDFSRRVRFLFHCVTPGCFHGFASGLHSYFDPEHEYKARNEALAAGWRPVGPAAFCCHTCSARSEADLSEAAPPETAVPPVAERPNRLYDFEDE